MKDTDIINLYNQRDERAIYETHPKKRRLLHEYIPGDPAKSPGR